MTSSGDAAAQVETQPQSAPIVPPGSPEQVSQAVPATPEGVRQLEQLLLSDTLKNASQLFLELGDPRMVLTALARQLNDEPLAQELRANVLSMLKAYTVDMLPQKPHRTISEDQRQRLTNIQEAASQFLPANEPVAESEFVKFLKSHNLAGAAGMIRERKIDKSLLAQQILEQKTDLGQLLWAKIRRPPDRRRYRKYGPEPDQTLGYLERINTKARPAPESTLGTDGSHGFLDAEPDADANDGGRSC